MRVTISEESQTLMLKPVEPLICWPLFCSGKATKDTPCATADSMYSFCQELASALKPAHLIDRSCTP